MKIEKKKIIDFLKKVKMSSRQEITECILRFEKDGLKIDANSDPKQARVMGWLNTGAFKEYEEIGKIGVNDFPNIIKVFERFGENIALKKDGNLLTVNSEGKKVEIELVAEDFLGTDTGEPALEFEETFTISKSKLGEIIKDVQMNKDAVLTIETEEKKVKFSNTGKYKFTNEVVAETCKGGVKVKFGEPLIESVAELSGNLEMSIKNDYPVKIREKSENSIVTIIVAPRVEDDE